MSPSSARRPKASIVIRSFNEEQHLGNLLAAIQKQNFADYEIILVDSGSTDRTLEIAAQHPIRIEHIDSQAFTFGRSLNLGIQAAKGEIAVIASAHVLPLGKDWIAKLIAPFEEEQVALSYGMQRGGVGSHFSEDQHWRHWFPEQSDLDQASSFCNNANSAIRISIWQQQPFDEELTGLEDIAWASWAKHQGYKIAYVAEAGVAHLHDETPAQVVNRYRREAIALKQILPESRFTFWHFLTHWLQKTVADMRVARRAGVLIHEFLPILAFRRRQYWGTYLGYQQSSQLSAAKIQSFYYPPTELEPQRAKNSAALDEVQT